MRVIKRRELNKIVEMKLAMFREVGAEEELVANPEEKILKTYRDLYDEDKMRHFVSQEQGKIVACAGGFIKTDIPHSFFKPTYYGFIGDVYTYPEYRRQGKATDLTEKVIAWLKKKEVKEIRLFASEAGRDIYESLGFKQSDEMILQL
jgi:predicted GNAT family acetyltransferase